MEWSPNSKQNCLCLSHSLLLIHLPCCCRWSHQHGPVLVFQLGQKTNGSLGMLQSFSSRTGLLRHPVLWPEQLPVSTFSSMQRPLLYYPAGIMQAIRKHPNSCYVCILLILILWKTLANSSSVRSFMWTWFHLLLYSPKEKAGEFDASLKYFWLNVKSN